MAHRNTHPTQRTFMAAEAAPRDGDIVIIGAGLAGLYTALKLAPLPVTVIAAAPVGQGASSMWAQGGIAAAVGEGDSADKHVADTIAAGAGIVDKDVAQLVAEEARSRIADLLRYGVPFDRDLEGHYVLSKEAAHSEKRVVRVSGDRAGAAIMQSLIAAVRKTPSIRILEGYEADDLIAEDSIVKGVRLIRAQKHGNGTYIFVPASAVVLATGGIGALYAVTTNPHYARGESIAMAARAGAVISDPEFIQFHPTAMNVGLDPAPLATEALRGDGAILVNGSGEAFMARYDARAELAPRDIVARAVFEELADGGEVFLDCREAIGDEFEHAFPTVWNYCQQSGINPTKELIPVSTAAHYHMGGIATDDRGRSSLTGLWAVGEVASTGLHGGNRLASNSLLEAVVFGARVAGDISSVMADIDLGHFVEPQRIAGDGAASEESRAEMVSRLRETMTRDVGVVRMAPGLHSALTTLKEIQTSAAQHHDTVLANMALAARFIAAGALLRKESRGGHYRSDFPNKRPSFAYRTMITIEDVEALHPDAQPSFQAVDCEHLHENLTQ